MKNKTIVLGSQKMNLYYPRPRKQKSEYSSRAIGTIDIKKLQQRMEGMKLMTLQDLLFLMENQHLIPKEWKNGFDWKTGKFNRIFFFGDMPRWGWQHEWFNQVPYLRWMDGPFRQYWHFGWELFSGYLASTDKRDDCVAVHGSILSNYVSRALYHIAQLPGKIKEAEEKEERDRKERQRSYLKYCVEHYYEHGPYWLP